MQQTLIQQILTKVEANSKFIDQQNLISKLSLLELLQSNEKYLCLDSSYSTTYYKRIETSLQFIPDDLRPVALVLFANVFYVGEGLLSDALVYLFREVLAKHGDNYDHVVKSMHVFETDPSGLIEAFFRVNHIEGRLDSKTFSRCKSVGEFINSLNNFNTCGSLRKNEALKTSIKALLDKKIWILISDFSFSGTSIKSDIERMIKVRNICYPENKKKPEIIICVQIISSKALKLIQDTFGNEVTIYYAQYYDDQLRVLPPNAWNNERDVNSSKDEDKSKNKLKKKTVIAFKNPPTLLFEGDDEIYNKVVSLCTWFAETFIDRDPDHDQTRGQCKRNTLAFGYQDCGYTVIPQRNALSNSLPILWYKPSKAFRKKFKSLNYIPPFPRTISRVNQTKSGDSDHLKEIENNKIQLAKLLKDLMTQSKKKL